MNLYHYFEIISLILEVIGVIIIFLGVIFAFVKSFLLYKSNESRKIYHKIRQSIAHSILLGLEILIAVDIIKTVTTQLTIENALTLGLIVIIRTILSISLEFEINNRFPWQKNTKNTTKINENTQNKV